MRYIFVLIVMLMVFSWSAFAEEKRGLVDEMDTNNNQLIERSEWLRHSGKRFDQIDTNNDGRIDKREFEAILQKVTRTKSTKTINVR